MKRREFLGLGLMVSSNLIPSPLSAMDFRTSKPTAWTSETVDDAIKALYGEIQTIESDILLKAPKVTSHREAIPLIIRSNKTMKSLSIFQDSNISSTVASYTMNKDMIVNLSIKIKMGKSGKVTIIGEGQDGKFYTTSQKITIERGGCD